MTGKNILKLTACIALPLMIGGVSGFITAEAIPGWYATLNKPFFNPPNYVFGPVWTILYILMGVSFYQILNSAPGEYRTRALSIFFIQLSLNFFWSIIFFSFKRVGAAMIDIVLLWVCIILMIAAFKKIKPFAAYLQVPYLLWVTFASALNLGILLLN